ncbi:hypothetical protein AXG93_1865s1020 [Marchantia polymorpha subsp. ruderalis]|uniref:Uncharacterized protein n=1 Tax=Marchantia polymorpha subsp. ruderalis TaxID=1480154 RepID=A0A176WJ92_MARPO|nr:hypothetical protein AXG93_1865s1020 [Marchantia polymorpha subsp. ruderalis]
MFMPSSSGISTGFPPGLLGSVCRMRTEGPDEASKAMWRGQAKERGQSCLQLRATIAQQTTDEFLGKFKLQPAAHSMSRGKADPQRKGFRPRKEDCISVSSESDPLNSLLARRPHRPAPALIVEEQKISSEGSEPPAAGGLDTVSFTALARSRACVLPLLPGFEREEHQALCRLAEPTSANRTSVTAAALNLLCVTVPRRSPWPLLKIRAVPGNSVQVKDSKTQDAFYNSLSKESKTSPDLKIFVGGIAYWALNSSFDKQVQGLCLLDTTE